jgi:small subunit ribosomal protein S1
VRGSVTRLADFGAFIRIAPGLEGLLHVSELGGKVNHPSDALKVGDTLTVVVRSVDAGARKISLAPAPEGLEVGAEARGPSIAVGAIVNGTVDRVEPYGVFLQVEGTRGRVGRGLIPNAELGTPRGSDTRKLFPLGTKLSAKVLETGEGKLKLSLRAIKDDEERADFDGYRAQAASAGKLGTLADLLKKKWADPSRPTLSRRGVELQPSRGGPRHRLGLLRRRALTRGYKVNASLSEVIGAQCERL